MDSPKKVVRAGVDKVRKTVRDADVHSLKDDVANIGDAARTKVGNASDDVRSGAHNAKRDAERHQSR
jgi:hypothetical protein